MSNFQFDINYFHKERYSIMSNSKSNHDIDYKLKDHINVVILVTMSPEKIKNVMTNIKNTRHLLPWMGL